MANVVRNLPEFVRRDEEKDQLFLTDWAKKHVDRCCLRFVQKYVQKNVGRYVYGRMYYDADYVKQCEFYLSDLVNEKQLSLPDARYEYEKEFPETFKEAFEELMHKNEETQGIGHWIISGRRCGTRELMRLTRFYEATI